MRAHGVSRLVPATLLVFLIVGPDGRAWNSNCGVGPVECPDGYAAARTQWGIDPTGDTDTRSEHRTIWLRARNLGGLPASLDQVIRLPVFTSDETIHEGALTYRSFRPLRINPARTELRVTSLGELAQLPDFSYTFWDWAMGNETCPPDRNLDPAQCHNFRTHLGLLNSSHFVPQAERYYQHYHALALQRARECKNMHDEIQPQDNRFLPYVLACEKEAMALEAVGHHYLQDAWSMGHMWERWGGPDVGDFGGSPTLGAAIGAYSGIIHGVGAVTGPLSGVFEDPMCAPLIFGVDYIDAGTGAREPGIGDQFLDNVLIPATEAQRFALFGCTVDGMRAVYGATAMAHGLMGLADVSKADPGRHVDNASCWGQRATNYALNVGFGIHKGFYPIQTLFIGLPEGIVALALLTFTPLVGPGLPNLTAAEAFDFSRDAAWAATLAHLVGVFPSTAFLTNLASGSLPDIARIHPNSFYARGGTADPSRLPSSYADPFLPWGLGANEKKDALHLLFAEAHVQDLSLAKTQSVSLDDDIRVSPA